MNKQVLTLAIPTYNRQEHLEELLEKLARMPLNKFWQVVVADNHSSYDVRHLVEKFQANINIKCFVWEKNTGSTEGNIINLLKSYSIETPYLIVLGDDDLPQNKAFTLLIESLINDLEKNQKANLISIFADSNC